MTAFIKIGHDLLNTAHICRITKTRGFQPERYYIVFVLDMIIDDEQCTFEVLYSNERIRDEEFESLTAQLASGVMIAEVNGEWTK